MDKTGASHFPAILWKQTRQMLSCNGYRYRLQRHELLKLRIKDIVYKNAGNSQYAQIQVYGKIGTRTLPLIQSIPYVKDWIDDHPQRANPNAHLFCGMKKILGEH